jgi:molecular chaperone HscC
MKSAVVGIDLGTTFSLVATLRGGAPFVIPNALGELLTPSAVSVADDGAVLVGAPARARATTHPTRTALAFKRDMGTDRVHELGPRRMTPLELSALVLASLKRDAEVALGCAVEEAVVTVPAYFGDLQRQATRDAGAIAGLRVDRIINEPTAAALAYGLHERHREVRAVVLDLGGGTFDVTVLEIIEGVVEIQASAGDARLGGEDFDAALAERFAEHAQKQRGWDLRHDPRAWARLREASEEAKKRLTDAATATVALVDLPLAGGKSGSLELSISRDEAEEAWGPLLDRIRAPIQRALRDAKIAPRDVDEVLLVGGSTRMPVVARLAAQVFGRLPLRALPPDEAVAMGAAVQAALKEGDAAVEDMVVTDIAPFTMGIATGSQLGQKHVTGLFTPILERGTAIPASRLERFYTMGDMQQQIHVEVYQGEHSLCRDNQKLGAYKVAVPPKPAGEESVDVRFTYDLNGILEVETTVVSSGKKETLVIEKSPGRMTRAEVEAARKAMARLKLHPRDALPNTTALARADALYVELSGPARQELGRVIALFRAALEGQDEREIAPLREQLLARIAAYKRR